MTKHITTPPTSRMMFESSVLKTYWIGLTIARVSPESRCVRSPVRMPSKKAMSCTMIARYSRERTHTMMRRPTRLKQSERSPPKAPVVTDRIRYHVTTSRNAAVFPSHSALPCAAVALVAHAVWPAITASMIRPWKLGMKRLISELAHRQSSATPNSGRCGATSFSPRAKYAPAPMVSTLRTPLSPRSCPSPADLSFLLKHAGHTSKSQSAQRYACLVRWRQRSHWWSRVSCSVSVCGWSSGTKNPSSAVSALISRFISHDSMLMKTTTRPKRIPCAVSIAPFSAQWPWKEMHLTPT